MSCTDVQRVLLVIPLSQYACDDRKHYILALVQEQLALVAAEHP